MGRFGQIRSLVPLALQAGGSGAYGLREATIAPDPSTDFVIPVVWTQGADVVRRSSFGGGGFIERLSLAEGAVNLDRLNNGAPFLDSHNDWRLLDVLGVVLDGSATISDGEGRALVRMDDGDPTSMEVYRKIRNGILRKVSVGYSVDEYEIIRAATENDLDIVNVTRWTPHELSGVPIAADDAAGFRILPLDGDSEKRFFSRGLDMNLSRFFGGVRRVLFNGHDLGGTGAGTRAGAPNGGGAPAPAPTPVPAGAAGASPGGNPNPVPDATTERAIARVERDRIKAIRAAGKRLGVPDEFVEGLVNGDVPVDAARSQLFAEAERREPATSGAHSGVSVGTEEGTKLVQAWRKSILATLDPKNNAHDEGSRKFAGYRIADYARDALVRSGKSTDGMDPLTIVRSALRLRTEFGMEHFERGTGMHSTDDFPLLLADVQRQTLANSYKQAPKTFEAISRREDQIDLREVKSLQFGEAPDLKPVDEHGEFTYGTMSESRQGWRIYKAGRILSVTDELLINDWMKVLATIPARFGRAAARYQANAFWKMFKAAAALSDGVAVFHADHNNLVSGGGNVGAPTVTTLAATRLKLDKQTDMDGNPIDVGASYIVGPPELRTAIAQLLSTEVIPSQGSNVVPNWMRGLVPVIEGRLSAGSDTGTSAAAWYLLTDPAEVPTLVHGGLQGRGDGPVIEVERSFESKGYKWSAEIFFGCAWEDFRGAVKNPGA